MSAGRISETEVILQSLQVRPDDYIELTFVEARDQGEVAGLVKTLIIEAEVVLRPLNAALDAIGELIEESLVILRNPPKSTQLAFDDDDDE